MKKILICSAFPTSSTGGAELYGKKIIDTFKSQYDFTELCMYLDEKNSEKSFIFLKILKKQNKLTKRIYFIN